MLCPKCNSTVTKMPGVAPQRPPSLLLGCIVMFLSWIVFVVCIAMVGGLARRFLFNGSGPELLPKIVTFLPLMSGILILVIGLIVYSRKKKRHDLLISEL